MLFCSAATAARLTFSGVSKSGSPGPKSTTSTPRSRRALASIMTARVGDTLTASSRRARRMPLRVIRPLHPFGAQLLPAAPRAASPGSRRAAGGGREAPLQPGGHLGRNETGHVATEAGHFL